MFACIEISFGLCRIGNRHFYFWIIKHFLPFWGKLSFFDIFHALFFNAIILITLYIFMVLKSVP